MDPKQKKLAIGGAVLLLVVLLFLVTDAGEKLGRFVTITGNIATNLAHPAHGDTRKLETVDAAFIEKHTGSTDRVDEAMLPKALRPIKEHTHPPFRLGACQVCHAPTRSKPAAILTKRVETLCYACHEPVSEAKALDCNRCHNPHHADREKLLRHKVTERECPVGTFR